MASSHPYISGAGNITAIITQLRKNFPATVTSETVKKFGIASNNESYVINALQFIGVIDGEGKRIDRGHEVLTTHDPEEFKKEFSALVKEAYKDLFDTHGDDAWELDRNKLVNYFRKTDKTSDIVGKRQAGVFGAFAALAGHGEVPAEPASGKLKTVAKPKTTQAKKNVEAAVNSLDRNEGGKNGGDGLKRNMALTVRIEINLPAGGTQEVYDSIFKSIKANLIDE